MTEEHEEEPENGYCEICDEPIDEGPYELDDLVVCYNCYTSAVDHAEMMKEGESNEF